MIYESGGEFRKLLRKVDGGVAVVECIIVFLVSKSMMMLERVKNNLMTL